MSIIDSLFNSIANFILIHSLVYFTSYFNLIPNTCFTRFKTSVLDKKVIIILIKWNILFLYHQLMLCYNFNLKLISSKNETYY